MREAVTLNQAFVAAASALRRGGIETPELDARLLLCHAASLSHEAYIAGARETLPPASRARLDEAIARRRKHEPVARIMGSREFYGRSFLLDPHALDPRPDTETLVEAALAIVERKGWREKKLNILDLGTGTGCILLTLLAELPQARGAGADRSLGALRLAAANAARLGLAHRASFIAADWLDGIAGTFDLIVSNPPYIASAKIAELAGEVAGYDPILALDGGPDGLQAYRDIAAGAGRVLAENGSLLLEIGPTQAVAVASILRASGLNPEGVERDLARRPRVVVGAR
jgi:release factor glutamine methyltransferase